MARTCLTIILAAGEGSRMKSATPKVLHELAGKSLVGHVIGSAIKAGGDTQAVVVGRDADLVEAEARRFSDDVVIVEQKERLGTGHAVLCARDVIARGFDDILVVTGDTPLLRPESLLRLRRAREHGADVVVLGFRTDEPFGYGRLIESDGELLAIREHRDCSDEELKIRFCNGGIIALNGDRALEILEAIGNDNAKNEYYLTDAVEIARSKRMKTSAIEADENELHGVNDRYDLARVEGIWQSNRRSELMRSGVTMQAPETVHLCHDTVIGTDTVLEPNIYFGPGVEIAEGVQIRAFCHLEGVRIAAGAQVGPFARLRPGTVLKEDAKVGNFCEVKNAAVEKGAKINHLSYIGDARVGAKANIGAGTITCNYDGANKWHTDIGAGAFIGTNSSLVAPVKIGDGAYVGSGSVIVSDVASDALAIARGRQVVMEGRGREIRERNARIKEERKKSR
ncbi:MAG: bifunctional UDP-N-acetylglucosamine diphosphorylase/glucosamine-1-phosphate N-acetyltransferase GlmU [Nitratireductor sp.]|nr:bifunctional UDP-N-acetylglucosamine diphosphorylase/glucosamine-1-phosphate N-acetyltransferase GlmU [Nitratireductor sp.]